MTLMEFLVRLAIDADSLGAFVNDPQSAAREAGLSEEDQRILLSKDQNRIYAALRGRDPKC